MVVLIIAIYGLAFPRGIAEQQLLSQARAVAGNAAVNAIRELDNNVHASEIGNHCGNYCYRCFVRRSVQRFHGIARFPEHHLGCASTLVTLKTTYLASFDLVRFSLGIGFAPFSIVVNRRRFARAPKASSFSSYLLMPLCLMKSLIWYSAWSRLQCFSL